MVVGFIRLHWGAPFGLLLRVRWVNWGAPWGSSGSFEVAGFVRARPGLLRVNSKSLGFIVVRPRFVVFIRVR